MAYKIEFSQDRVERFYAEFAFVNRNNDQLVMGTGIDHQLVVYGEYSDYNGNAYGGRILASNTDGNITIPEDGVIAVNVPSSSFVRTWNDYGFRTLCGSMKCRLLAVPTDTDYTTVLADIIIHFDDSWSSNPRITAGSIPIYPNQDDA